MAVDDDTLSRPCPQHGDRASADPSRWLSTHRTSAGLVVYYRCSCGRPAVAVRPPEGAAKMADGGSARDRMPAGSGATSQVRDTDDRIAGQGREQANDRH